MSPTSSDKFQFILGRRSIRVYAPGDVGEAAITQLLQAAMAAPSAVVKDPWRFVVIRNSRPTSVLPVAGIAIGRPGEAKEPRTRFNRDYVHWEEW